MKRRRFLKTMGAAAPGALAAGALSAQPAKPETSAPEKEPRVFHYDDGRHASGLYQFQPPLAPDDLTRHVDQLIESGVDTLFYSAGLEGGALQYDSRVGDKWGDNVQEWKHPIFFRASRNLQQLIADGHDPMQIMAERCQEKGIFFFPTLPVSIQGGDRETSLGYGRKSDFAYNSKFYVGEDSDPRAVNLGRFLGPTRMNFLHAEVRQERFRIFEELLTRYASDGVELDLSIDNEFGPMCKFRDLEKYRAVLTAWIRDVRKVADAAASEQGRRKRVYVRIPATTPDVWRSIGYDIATWVSEKLVDGLVCITPYKKETRTGSLTFFDQDLDIRAAVKLTQGTECRILTGIASHLGRQLDSIATPEMTWAAAALAYELGSDGFGFASGMWAPHGWPWKAEDYSTLRLLGHPDMLAKANKTYFAPSQSRGEGTTLRDGRTLLPIELVEGKAVTIPLRVVDDLERWSRLGRIHSVRLFVRLANFCPSIDAAEISFNGKKLPESLGRGSDMHFRVLEEAILGPYGYAVDFALPEELYPKHGRNEVSVTLTRHEARLHAPRNLYDVALLIEYLPHRNFPPVAVPF